MSQPDLFTVEETLSPRLAWMREHSVKVRRNQDVPPEAGQWEAWTGEFTSAVEDVAEHGDTSKRMGYGHGEVAAVLDLAERNGWEGW